MVLATTAAAATALALAACSGLDSSDTVLIQQQGQILGFEALGATSDPDPAPIGSPAPNDYSMNSGWVDVAGCPAAVFQGVSVGFAGHGTVAQTVPSTSSGPAALPALTSKFVPSCSFTFSDSNGINGTGEIFIGMGENYEKLFASGVLNAGYTLRQSANFTSAYSKGTSVVGIQYLATGYGGFPYSVVSVFGASS